MYQYLEGRYAHVHLYSPRMRTLATLFAAFAAFMMAPAIIRPERPRQL